MMVSNGGELKGSRYWFIIVNYVLSYSKQTLSQSLSSGVSSPDVYEPPHRRPPELSLLDQAWAVKTRILPAGHI